MLCLFLYWIRVRKIYFVAEDHMKTVTLSKNDEDTV